MPDLYAASDVILLPSLYEGLSNAIIEASHSGVPAIVSAAANADQLVLDRKTGREVPTDDAASLADAIAELSSMSHAERRALGASAHQHVSSMLDADRSLRATLDLYEGLLARKLPHLAKQLPCAV